MKRKAAAVFVMVDRGAPKQVIGFDTLFATSVELSSLPTELTKRLPRYPEIHAILVARLARDVSYPGLGELLILDALARCVCVANEIAANLIIVDSKGEAATRFYEKFGFISLPKLTDRKFLPMQTAERL